MPAPRRPAPEARRLYALSRLDTIYARKSTDQRDVSDEARSIARQIGHARAYATKKGWAISEAHIFIDDGVS